MKWIKAVEDVRLSFLRKLSYVLISLCVGLLCPLVAFGTEYVDELPNGPKRVESGWNKLENLPNEILLRDSDLENLRKANQILQDFGWTKDPLELVEQNFAYSAWSQRTGYKVDDLSYLRLKDFDVSSDSPGNEGPRITTEGNLAKVQVLLAYDLRYKVSGMMEKLVNFTLWQGTLVVFNTVNIEVDQATQKVVSVNVQKFADSSWLERRGRTVGFISPFDGEFAEGIGTPILTEALKNNNLLNEVLEKSGALAKLNSLKKEPREILQDRQ